MVLYYCDVLQVLIIILILLYPFVLELSTNFFRTTRKGRSKKKSVLDSQMATTTRDKAIYKLVRSFVFVLQVLICTNC